MITRLLPVLFACLLATSARAQQSAATPTPRPRDVSVELQCISLPQPVALPLVRRLRSEKPEERSKALEEVEQLLAKGAAKLLGWPLLLARTGEKATHKATEEIRYATEFAPPTLQVALSDKDGNLLEYPGPIRGNEVQPIASSFDTRETGLTFEATATPAEEGGLLVEFKAKHVRLKSIDRTTIEHVTEKRSEKIVQEQPRFTSLEVASQLTLQSGERKLVGVFNVPDTENVLELFILGAELAGKK